jgi:molybdate transport repressor ModE-like protein/molybdopterin-binding protein
MRQRVVTDTDIALLRSLARERSVVAASRSVGISRDRATYRIERLRRAVGGAVVTSVRGGRGHGGTHLTALGDRIVREGFDSLELPDLGSTAAPSDSNRLRGVYHRRPFPEVAVRGGLRLRVSFAAIEGEPVTVRLGPESILVARGRFPSSARNVLRATVEGVRSSAGSIARTLVVRVRGRRLRVGVTEESIRQLRLVPGARVWLYVKATAVRRAGPAGAAPTRGSPRS